MPSSARRRRSVAERFWTKVDKGAPEDCWTWNRGCDSHGYGQFKAISGGSPQKASRFAWILARGPIPDGLIVCHRCDNPPCCNPGHLFLGTHKDNSADMVAKGRQRFGGDGAGDASTLIARVRRLSDEEIREARRLHGAGQSSRTIGRRFGVHHTTIVRLANGKHWSSLPEESDVA